MAEDNQDMEMEDILSSIKNILEEDEHQKSAAEPQAESDVLDDVLNAPADVDDILELSPEMRIKDEPARTEPVFEPAAEEKDIVAAVTEKGEEGPFGDVAASEDIAAAVPDAPAVFEDRQPEEDETGLQIGREDFASDPVFDEDYQMPEAAVETSVEPEAAVEAEPVAGMQPKPEVLSEPETPEEVEIPAVKAPVEPEIVVEAEPAASEEPVEIPVEPEVPSEPETPAETLTAAVEKEAVADSAVDVSANIISNFAKMFSHDETPAAPVAEVSAPVIPAPGDTSKTLEEFVLDAIVKVIGGEISRQWNDGADFKAFAEAEIIRQTEKWISDNLPMLVEKVVKQEIERVIAKVGS